MTIQSQLSMLMVLLFVDAVVDNDSDAVRLADVDAVTVADDGAVFLMLLIVIQC